MDSKKVLAEGTFYRKIILLDISSAMNFTIRSTFISKETRNGSFHGSTSSEYNAAFLCKGQVTSLLIVVYLIEQDNTPIRVLERARKKEEQEGVDSSGRGTRNIRGKIRRRLRSSGRNVSKRAEEARKRFR